MDCGRGRSRDAGGAWEPRSERRSPTLQALTAHLLTQKSYAPTHESAAVTLMANAACRARAAQLLNALCAVLRDPANANTPLFTRIAADSTADMHVFRFVPP